MRLRDKIAVPELSAAASARIEARFVSAVRNGEAKRPPWLSALKFAGVGVAVVGVAAAVLLNLQSAWTSRGLASAASTPTVTEVVTSSDGATLRLGDAAVTLAPHTSLSLLRLGSGETHVALERGRVDCEVEPTRDRAPFFVAARDIRVRVIGTVFSVQHDRAAAADLAVHVGVTRGQVAVMADGSEVMVSAGRAWNARDGVAAVVAATPSVPPAAGDEATAAVSDAGDRVDVSADNTPSGPGRQANSSRNAVSRPKKGADDRAASGLPRPRRMSAPSSVSHRDLVAAMELDAKDPRAAIRLYTRIATQNHRALASFALYSRAYLEYTKLGDRTATLRTLDLFRRRFRKRTRETESALWLQIKSLCELGRQAACRSAAHSYLRRFSSGRFADAAKQIADDLD